MPQTGKRLVATVSFPAGQRGSQECTAEKVGGQLFCLKLSVTLTSLQGACPCHQSGLWALVPPSWAVLSRIILHGLHPAVRLVLAQPGVSSVVVLLPSAIFSNPPLICPDDFAGGNVQWDVFTGQGITAAALWRCRCWRNAICLCFICTALLQGAVLSVTIQGVFKSKVFGLVQIYLPQSVCRWEGPGVVFLFLVG